MRTIDRKRLSTFLERVKDRKWITEEELKELRDILGVPQSGQLISFGSRRARGAHLKPRELVAKGLGEMTISQAAKLLRMTTGGVRAAVQRGSIKARKIGSGRLQLVDAFSLRAYMERTGRAVTPR